MRLNRWLKRHRNEDEEKEREKRERERERQAEVERIQQGLHDAASRVHFIEVTKQLLERERALRDKGGQ